MSALQDHTSSALREILHAWSVTACHGMKLPLITKDDKISAGPVIFGCFMFYHLTTNFLCWGEMNTKARHPTYLGLSSILLCLMKKQEF